MRTAYIGMGANLPSWAGPPEATLTAAAANLEALGRVERRSSLWSTEPVGFAAQPRFVNAVVELRTGLEPRQLLAGLLKIEQEFGRDRSAGVPNGPRTLDLDFLLLDDARFSEPGLEIPHPRLAGRAFVLIPLCEISPSLVEPISGQTVSQLLDNLRNSQENGPAHLPKNEYDEAIPIPWDDWHAGAGRVDAGQDRPLSASAGEHDPHRRR